ncbi:putative sterile alpha motif domain-containing protein [Arabidopsis thaliana]
MESALFVSLLGLSDLPILNWQRQDDKWEHDLFSSDKPQLSSISSFEAPKETSWVSKWARSWFRRAGFTGSALWDNESATKNSDPPKSKAEAARPSMKSVATETETRKTSSQATRKKSQQADSSVDSFLESLGLEKYSTAFQVEEVDMDALMHMTDDDLKAMLIPMGPRKKILLALGSKP